VEELDELDALLLEAALTAAESPPLWHPKRLMSAVIVAAESARQRRIAPR
jgi:hypothetical protein